MEETIGLTVVAWGILEYLLPVGLSIEALGTRWTSRGPFGVEKLRSLPFGGDDNSDS